MGIDNSNKKLRYGLSFKNHSYVGRIGRTWLISNNFIVAQLISTLKNCGFSLLKAANIYRISTSSLNTENKLSINVFVLNPLLDLINVTKRQMKKDNIINPKNIIWLGESGSLSTISRNINRNAILDLRREEGFNKVNTIDSKTKLSSTSSYFKDN